MPSASASLPPLHPSKTSSSVSEDLKNTLLPQQRSDFIGSSFGGSFRESIPASIDHKRSKWGKSIPNQKLTSHK
jgi:hypothetical protein